MTMFTTIPREVPPTCFGVQWDRNEPECAGGADPSFAPKETDDHAGRNAKGDYVRLQCKFFQSCGARVTATKNANGNLISQQQLIRPPAVQQPQNPTQFASTQTFGQWLKQQQQQQQQAQQQNALATRPQAQSVPVPPQVPPYMQQQQMQQMYAYMQQQQMQQMMPNFPASTYQLNYISPPFLSQPEVRRDGETMWAVLGRETVRSMLKAAGQAFAHHFDSRLLK